MKKRKLNSETCLQGLDEYPPVNNAPEPEKKYCPV